MAFAHALRAHLRGESGDDDLNRLLPAPSAERIRKEPNRPYALLQLLGESVAEARRKGWVHPYHVQLLDQSLTELTHIQGACERIKSTPIPYSYTVLMHRIVALYCALLPFGLMDTVHGATPVVVLCISYCFFGLDAIGEEVEQPFGTDPNDLPLEAISRTIERDLWVRLGKEPPPPLAPVGGILS